MKWFYKLERKFGKYAIQNLMYYITIIYAIGFVIAMFAPELYVNLLSLDVEMILKGQVWRVVTFILQPPSNNILFVIISLYFYYMIGSNLERNWGSFRFNLYYFLGVLLQVIAVFVVYFVFGLNYPITTHYINLSLFLAFACTYPDMQILLFFILPIKMKWLGIIEGAYFGIIIVFGYLFPMLGEVIPRFYIGLANCGIYAIPQTAVPASIALLNFLIFFAIIRSRNRLTPAQFKRKIVYQAKIKAANAGSRHKCAICGQTESNPELTFRYCSKCEGNYEYCNEHLYTHQHVKSE